jgi:hypothetical protein
MTVEGFELVVNELLDANPFRIFTVQLKNDTLYEIDHPPALHFEHGVAVFTGPGGVKKVFDCDSVLQIIPAPAEDAAK